MEIVFFAILSAFLLLKLWSILGVKQEKIQRNNKNELVFSSLSPLEKIRTFEPKFLESDFLESAKKAFLIITKAYKTCDKETLKMLLTNDLYEKISKQMEEKNQDEYEEPDPTLYLQTIDFDEENNANISVTIVSYQDNDPIHDYWIFTKNFKNLDSYWRLSSMRAIDV